MSRLHLLIPCLLFFACIISGCDKGSNQNSPSDSIGYDATGLPPGGPVCQENCIGRVCGPDRCGGTCGTCEGEDLCLDGQCYQPQNPVCDELGNELDLDDGYCDGMTAVWCVDGEIKAVDCEPDKWEVCGLNEQTGEWGCGSVDSLCVPDCKGKQCGGDGCVGECGMGCPPTLTCYEGACCEPQCQDIECGDNGCGGSCGSCSSGKEECAGGECVCSHIDCGGQCCSFSSNCWQGHCCEPDCDGKECGDDGCGDLCGECPDLHICTNDDTCDCQHETCDGVCCESGRKCFEGECCNPNCDGKNCGDDGCGGQCGECVGDGLCIEGACCVSECQGKECGEDGCGGTCGECFGAQDECTAGICQCIPDCAGKDCGDDGCELTCGECSDSEQFCDEEGLCKDCGPGTSCYAEEWGALGSKLVVVVGQQAYNPDWYFLDVFPPESADIEIVLKSTGFTALTLVDVFLEGAGNQFATLQWTSPEMLASLPLTLVPGEQVEGFLTYEPVGEVLPTKATMVVWSSDLEALEKTVVFAPKQPGPDVELPKGSATFGCAPDCQDEWFQIENGGDMDVVFSKLEFVELSEEWAVVEEPAPGTVLPPFGAPGYKPLSFAVEYCDKDGNTLADGNELSIYTNDPDENPAHIPLIVLAPNQCE
jgi:hypothetical protein